MRSKTILKLKISFFILVFLGVFISPTSAQKIKIKKDVVLIDKTPAFQFVKLQGSLSKPFIWAIIKLNGDTSVVFRATKVEFPKYPHESTELSKSYIDVDFKGIDQEVVMTYEASGFRRKMATQLLEDEIITREGVIQEANIEKFTERQKSMVQLLEKWRKNVKDRKALLTNAEHVKFMGSLVSRYPFSELTYEGTKVMMSRTQIGFIKKVPNTQNGDVYRIYSKNDNRYVANMYYKKDKKITIITTIHDEGRYELEYTDNLDPMLPKSGGDGLMGQFSAMVTEQHANQAWFSQAMDFLIEKGYL